MSPLHVVRRWLSLIGLTLAIAPLAVVPARAAPVASVFITLGTQGGPIANPARSQPANVLLVGDDAYLIDVGDGAVERLAAANVPLKAVKAVFLSHLHFDHTGGLLALLGLRYQGGIDQDLTIYGPPGTQATVDGLLAAMAPAVAAGYGLPGQSLPLPSSRLHVIEVTGQSKETLGSLAVTFAENTHYSFPAGSEAASHFKSLSIRFDLPDRSVVYTGDTGPSLSVEALAKGADLLVSEMIDVDQTIANVRRTNPSLPPPALAAVEAHLARHHLTPEQVGQLAAQANVKTLVITHEAPGSTLPADLDRYRSQIGLAFKGPVTIAKDLDRF